MFLAGDGISEPGPRGDRVRDDDLLIAINAGSGPVDFSLPPGTWSVELDTGSARGEAAGPVGGSTLHLGDRRLVLLRRPLG